MIKLSAYNTPDFMFRSEHDPDKRDRQYYINNIQSLYSDYVRGRSSVGYSGVARIEYLRSVADGSDPIGSNAGVQQQIPKSNILDSAGNPITQDEEIYPELNRNHEVWDVISPIGKIMDALDGMFSTIEYDISCDPLDYNTQRKVENAKLRAWQFKQNRQKIALLADVAGVEVPEPPYIPEQPEDMDMNPEMFNPDHCRYVELVVKHSMDISSWSSTLKKMFYRDLLTLGFAAVRNEYDPATGKVAPVYVDPARADIQQSDYTDCHDSERGWHFELMSVSRLRQYLPDEDEAFFKKVAGSFCGMFGNPEWGQFSRYTVFEEYTGWRYNEFKVVVMHGEWIDIAKTKEQVGRKHGRKVVKTVPLSKRVAQDKTVRFTEDRMRFGCSWVVGTDRIFEYGPAHENTEPQPGDAELTYRWCVMPGRSKVEQLVPILRNFQSLWDKYRELLRNAQGKIQFVDIDMLASTGGGDPQVAAKRAFRRFLATNKLLFRRVNAAGMPNQAIPIAEMDGGMGSLFSEIQAAFNTNMAMIEYIVGLNPLSLGQSPDPNAPVTTSQMALNATSKVVRPLIDGYMRTRQMVAENLARWITCLLRKEEFSRRAYAMVIGDYGVQTLVAASREEAAYGFRMVPRPTELEKQSILQNVAVATDPSRGEREISTADANTIISMIAADTPVKTINYFFEQARRRQQASLMQQKVTLMQQQSQLNQQDAQVSAQTRMAETAATHKMNMELQALKNQGTVVNTQVQENTRAQKELAVQEKKNESEQGMALPVQP